MFMPSESNRTPGSTTTIQTTERMSRWSERIREREREGERESDRVFLKQSNTSTIALFYQTISTQMKKEVINSQPTY